eukprot:2224897-Ditylum_brightwellii.AAC.1
MVDEHLSMKFSSFFQTKNGMVEPTLEQFNHWKQKGIKVNYPQCDNAGENKTLGKWSQSSGWKMDIQFKYTARATSQQNHLAELGFASMTKKGRTMMHWANK